MLVKIKTLIIKYRKIIAYLFWGVMTTLVSWGTYSAFVLIGLSVTVSNILSWILAVLFAFVVNKLWVFSSKTWAPAVVLSELWKFFAARIVTGLLEIVGVPLLVAAGMNWRIFGIDGIAAKVIVSVAVIILNYVFSKLFVFRRKKKVRSVQTGSAVAIEDCREAPRRHEI